MGKLHSKHAAICKPRESPEGDSFVVNACLTRKGIDDWLVKQKYYCSRLEPRDCHHRNNCAVAARESMDEACAEGIADEHYRLEDGLIFFQKIWGMGLQSLVAGEMAGGEGDNRQEWTFTLYDFDNNGKVTREVNLIDITSLLHTIYEVVDASVNHSPSSSKTLRVKLSVAPDSSQRWRSCTQGAADMSHPREKNDKCIEDPKSVEKKNRALLRRHHSDHHTQPGCQRHCVDENLRTQEPLLGPGGHRKLHIPLWSRPCHRANKS
ncbi:hypothetical protein fugu_003000 [Takifugu bimaculatus]|uniref:Protein naked cuticle homolog n=1 Tax=Takifugu bimaculatus TaxID=433685 RepID=A0A4Z2BE66_9TELE|nr:hypothetical protein fugu_003000 [Takifugu bimaculatus]